MLADGRLVAVECWWCSEREREKLSGGCGVVAVVWSLSQLITAIFVVVGADFGATGLPSFECAANKRHIDNRDVSNRDTVVITILTN